MKKTENNSPQISLGDRLVTAVMSVIFAGITLVGYYFVAHSWGNSWRPSSYLFRNIFSSDISLYIIGIAALVGFLLGPERMGNIFGFFWGTNDSNK
ncbi:MAG: hypothetical protein ACXWJK_12945 [Burkholderiaceae bacterium]